MIKLEKTDVYGWEAAIRGMRNPKNSWAKSDSLFGEDKWGKTVGNEKLFIAGENDLKLMLTLANAGTDHGKFLRMIQVSVDITAPFYWWKEFDTYRMGVEKNSCSTMHKIQAKEFTLDDFSCEHLTEGSLSILKAVIEQLNNYRTVFNDTNDKNDWWQMIQLLPASYNQKRTCFISYAALKNMYHARNNHKLDEWHTFCAWVKKLPYSELITEKINNE